MGKDHTKFYDTLRESHLFGGALTSSEVSGCEAIINACSDFPVAQLAYALATAYHETGHTMQPVKEMGGSSYFSKYGRPPLMEQLGNHNMAEALNLIGRGYVQITGYTNYHKAGVELGLDLVNHPELALEPSVASRILRHGMKEGWFTGRSLQTYLPLPVGTTEEFIQARRIINGQDRAVDIASYANTFQKAIQAK